MQQFDLHPKAAISARTRSTTGGAITLATLLFGLILLITRAQVDFGKWTEDVRVNQLDPSGKMRLSYDVSFLDVSSCGGVFRVEVLDALGRAIPHDEDKVGISFWSKECRVQGHLDIPVGRGTFRIYPAMMTPDGTRGNHRVNAISFGDRLHGIDKSALVLQTESARTEVPGAWSYFVNLVPTTSNGVDGYQLAATRNFVELRNPYQSRGSIYFHYDSSPVRMFLENRLTLGRILHFFARALGIVSGLFAFVGTFREIFVNVHGKTGKRKKQSNLVM